MGSGERHILERAVRAVADQAAKADGLIDEALAAGLDGMHTLTINARLLRQELLDTKAGVGARARDVGPQLHGGVGSTFTGSTVGASRRATGSHAEPAPHGEPQLNG